MCECQRPGGDPQGWGGGRCGEWCSGQAKWHAKTQVHQQWHPRHNCNTCGALGEVNTPSCCTMCMWLTAPRAAIPAGIHIHMQATSSGLTMRAGHAAAATGSLRRGQTTGTTAWCCQMPMAVAMCGCNWRVRGITTATWFMANAQRTSTDTSSRPFTSELPGTLKLGTWCCMGW